MSLTIFLFKVANLSENTSTSSSSGSDLTLSTEIINEEDMFLFYAKVSFRGLSLWSNNVLIQNNTASFIGRGNQPKKFQFNLGTMLSPNDKLHIDFYTVTMKKKRKKRIAVFDILLETLIDTKYIDIEGENLSDANNRLLNSTIDMKLYYTPPNINREKMTLGLDKEDTSMTNWNDRFYDEDRQGGHRHQYVRSRKDSTFKKIRRSLARRSDDADTDSNSDAEFVEDPNTNQSSQPLNEEQKTKMNYNNLELLEKSLGRYEDDIYRIKDWQIMVHVIQGRDFLGEDLNSYVCIEIGNQTRYTVVQRSTNAPFFGEFFTFDFNLPATQMLSKVIYFKIHHQTKFLSAFTHSKPIGLFKVDVATVYHEKEHTFERKWAQLVDPNAIQVVFGHLLLSVIVTERGLSSKNILGERLADDDELRPSKAFIPSAMPRGLFPIQFKLTFYTATELPEMMSEFLTNVSKKILRSDAWEPVDPYVEVSYNGIEAKTDHRNGTSPVWGQAIYFIGQFPPLIRTIKISLKDHAAVQQDRVIASFLIDLFSISESNPAAGFLPTLGPTWIFLYGSPREYQINPTNDGLDQGMGEAVCYKGRLLMQIDCHPISGDHTSNNNVQKECGIQFPEPTNFPSKRTFVLFGCLFDVTMIDQAFGNTVISFELSIGSSGYSNPTELLNHQLNSSTTRPYPRIPIDNNKQHFRLPIDLRKPILFTKYSFHDYTYRMTLSNRLKRAAHHLSKLIGEFETHLKKNSSNEILLRFYRKIEHYLQTLPCGCAKLSNTEENYGLISTVHSTLFEVLRGPKWNIRMNTLDEKRQKKILHNLDTLKHSITSDISFDEIDRSELVQQFNKIVRSLQQLSVDIQPSLPDVFLWMICDAKRVAYARISSEDLLDSVCIGDKGLKSGRVQTLFLQTPNTSDKPVKSSTNAKVQIYLWLGTEEQQGNIFKQLPQGFDMPSLPLSIDSNYIHYHSKSLYELRCHCFRARSLLALDETGLSDPYLSITAGNETQTTPIQTNSLCPQWNITLAFQKLMYVGSREGAEDVIGHVVVECYDYDESDNASELMGRFSTTAKLDIFDNNELFQGGLFRWYEFKLGEEKAGELLAVFELIEVDPETGMAQSSWKLNEIELSKENFPPDTHITKLVKNLVYETPSLILPPTQPYEIEILFWGLRECRTVNLQPIQQAQVSIDCVGVRLTKTIRNVQKSPNFDYSSTDEDNNYKLLVSLPKNKDFWPNISINCMQNRLFGMKEVIGNFVLTNVPKYLEKSNNAPNINAVEQSSKTMSTDFDRVRKSVIDAYEATLSRKNQELAKQQLRIFENDAGREKGNGRNEQTMVNDDHSTSRQEKEKTDEEQVNTGSIDLNELIDASLGNNRLLTHSEKLKRSEMEKTANWWMKYYASKAKQKLEERLKADFDEDLVDSNEAYAQIFANERGIIVDRQQSLWIKSKRLFLRVGTAEKKFISKLKQKIEDFEERKHQSVLDKTIDMIEMNRLKELSLLQTFDIIESELENVPAYEGFHDCFDKFPLYKGKGTSCSNKHEDPNRVFAKFKGKIRIHEVQNDDELVPEDQRISVNPVLMNTRLRVARKETVITNKKIDRKILRFDFNRNPITLKCRLYIIKALIFRSQDQSGKADPYIKIALNDDVIINDSKGRIHNTLEPIFGKCYEFEVTVPHRSLLRIQLRDWDLAKFDDKIGETSIDIEDRWLSCHRAACGLPKRYDSAGYNAWRDTKTPVIILNELCQTANMNLPVYTNDMCSLAIGDVRFDCSPECIEFLRQKTDGDLLYRKAHHEPAEEYLRQNTALTALHGWGEKIEPNRALVGEHIECRSIYDPQSPSVEQGKLEMWMDMFSMSRPPSSSPVDITPPKPLSYQLRLIIWNTSDVELDDENFVTGEKTSDIYVKAWILGENEDAQQTDVHYRSLTGEGNFNWRFIFDFNYLDIEEKIVHEKKDSLFRIGTITKKIPPRIVIRVYDADLISADDFLGQCVLDMAHLPIGAKSPSKCTADMLLNSKQKSVNLFSTKRTVGWWPMIAPMKTGEIRDPGLLGGKVEVEFSLVTAEDAEKNPVGKAREGPSALDEPNRPKTSFLWFTSPWKTFRFVIWRNFKWPIIIGVIVVIFVIFLLLALWSLPGEIIRQVTAKILKTAGTGR